MAIAGKGSKEEEMESACGLFDRALGLAPLLRFFRFSFAICEFAMHLDWSAPEEEDEHNIGNPFLVLVGQYFVSYRIQTPFEDDELGGQV